MMKISGELLAILSAISIGISIPFGVMAAKTIGAFQSAVFMPLVSIAFLLAISVIAKHKIDIRRMLKKHFSDSITMVIARPVIGDLLLLYGFSLTTVVNASFMARLEPVFVTILGYILLKDSINRKQIFLILLMIAGIFLLSTGGRIESITQTQIGDILVAIGTLVISYSYIPARRIEKDIDPVTATFANNLIGGLILVPIMLAMQINPFTVSFDNLLILLVRAVSFYVVGLSLIFAALKRTKPWIVSSLLSLTSVIGAAIGFFILNEPVSTIQIAGMAIILFSSYFITRSLK